MTHEQERKLARISGCYTVYEMVAEHADGRRLLAGYTRETRPGMLAMLRKNWDMWCKLTGKQAGTWEAHKMIRFGAWTIRFSGRTQRQAIIEGELPWVGDVATD